MSFMSARLSFYIINTAKSCCDNFPGGMWPPIALPNDFPLFKHHHFLFLETPLFPSGVHPSMQEIKTPVYPVNTIHWTDVVLMLAHRLRRWPNIKTTLFQCIVLAGYLLSFTSNRFPTWSHRCTGETWVRNVDTIKSSRFSHARASALFVVNHGMGSEKMPLWNIHLNSLMSIIYEHLRCVARRVSKVLTSPLLFYQILRRRPNLVSTSRVCWAGCNQLNQRFYKRL